MRKAIIVLIILCIGLTACTIVDGAEKQEERFKVVYEQGKTAIDTMKIYEDTVTGKKYVFIKNGYGAGMCPLE